MKKIFLLFIAIILLTANYSQAESNISGSVFAGVDFSGECKSDELGAAFKLDTETSASVGAEVYYKVNKYFDTGMGAMFLFYRDLKVVSAGHVSVSYLPIYGLIKIHPQISSYTPYFVSRIGYNIFYAENYNSDYNLDGGLYWGAGAGLLVKEKFSFEIFYSENHSSATSPSSKADITNNQITFGVGYIF